MDENAGSWHARVQGPVLLRLLRRFGHGSLSASGKLVRAVAGLVLVGAVGCVAQRGAAPPVQPTSVLVPAPCPAAPEPAAVLPPPAGTAAPSLRPRSVQCEAVNNHLLASLQRSADGTHYAGGGTDNYDTVSFARCPTSTTSEIRCEGTWGFDQKPAVLRVIAQADGLVRGELTRSNGEVVVLSCVASVNDLRGG